MSELIIELDDEGDLCIRAKDAVDTSVVWIRKFNLSNVIVCSDPNSVYKSRDSFQAASLSQDEIAEVLTVLKQVLEAKL